MVYIETVNDFMSVSYSNLFQFDVLNTLSDQILENVKVAIEPSEGFKIIKEVLIPKLPYGETGHCFVVMEYPDDVIASVGE